jgi:hypothetical protein
MHGDYLGCVQNNVAKVLQSILQVKSEDLFAAKRHGCSSHVQAQQCHTGAGSGPPPSDKAQVGQKRGRVGGASEQAAAQIPCSGTSCSQMDNKAANGRAAEQMVAPVQSTRSASRRSIAKADHGMGEQLLVPLQSSRPACGRRDGKALEGKAGERSTPLGQNYRHFTAPKGVGASPHIKDACTGLDSGSKAAMEELESDITAWNAAVEQAIWDAKTQAALELSGISSAHDLVGICQDLCSSIITGAQPDSLGPCEKKDYKRQDSSLVPAKFLHVSLGISNVRISTYCRDSDLISNI